MISHIYPIIVYIVSFMLEYICLSTICRKKVRINIKNIIIIISLSLINYICTFNSFMIIKGFSSFTSIFIICLYVVKENERESLICTLLYYILLAIIEFIFSIIIMSILSVNAQEYVTHASYVKMTLSLGILLILYLTCNLNIVKNLYNKACDIFSKTGLKNEYILFFIFTITMVMIFYIINIAGNIALFYTILYIVILLVYIVYIFLSIHKTYYLKLLNKYLFEKDEEYQKIIDEYRMFKHNINHEFDAICSVGNEKVKKLVSEYLNEYNTNAGIAYTEVSAPNGLRGVIYKKILENKNNNINVMTDNFIESNPLDVLSVRKYLKLIEGIGIIIDNAFEYTNKLSNSFVYIYLGEDEDYYVIKCINTFKDSINLDEYTQKDKSTKENHSGIGLHYIKTKTNIDIKLRIINDTFVSTMKIKK